MKAKIHLHFYRHKSIVRSSSGISEVLSGCYLVGLHSPTKNYLSEDDLQYVITPLSRD
jgi:hypothetical protein